MKTSISITKVKTTREEALKALEKTDTEYIHIDMMDGKFVETKQLMSGEVISLCKGLSKKLDVHMMIQDPMPYIRELHVLDNINNITIHSEIGNTDYYIDCIHELGIKAGVAINPDTRVDILKPYLDTLDIVLIMGVTPGAGGQKLIINTLEKIKELVILRDRFDLDFEIEFDGGVNGETRQYLDGLDTIVSGSYVCSADNYQERINEIR